jgi:menaquinone-dependent protoporphyrinogen IX oxidase
MKKAVVVYQSKHGATEKYAKWISEELRCDLYERNHIKPVDLKQYDTIIYGGGLYAGGVAGIDLITKNFDQFCNQDLVLFTCGLADPLDKDNTDHIRNSLNKVFTAQMQEKIKVFHLRGAMDYAKLGPVHKAMMAMLHKMTTKKDPDSLRDEDKQMLATYGKTVDFTDKATILPIIRYIQEL